MEYFIIIYFCLKANCAVGWINQPFTEMETCNSYSNVYSREMQKRAPESSGEVYCVPKEVLSDAREQFSMIQLHKLEDIPSTK